MELGKTYQVVDFGDAIRAMKKGKKVARLGWNGKSMWVALTPGSKIPLHLARAGAAEHLKNEKVSGPLDEVNAIEISGHFDMRAADGTLVIGWLASQTDMLAEDWVILG